MGSAPDIIPISDLRRDTAGIIGRAVASGEPVYITQHGRATAVLVSRTEYEHLLRRLEILGRLTAGDTGVAPSSGSSLVEIRERATQKPTLVDTEFGLVDPATAALLTAEGFAVRPPVVPCEASPADEDESPGVVR